MARPRLARDPRAITSIAIVCGYDLDSDLAAYVRAVALRLAGVRIEAVIFSGGRTSPRCSSSEAEIMSAQFEKWVTEEQVLLDNDAMTTLDNIVFAKQIADERVAHVDRYLVCCDVAHAVKARLLARVILGRTARVLPVRRRVPLWIWLREPFSAAIELVGALVPAIQPWLSTAAARMKGVRPPSRSAQRASTA